MWVIVNAYNGHPLRTVGPDYVEDRKFADNVLEEQRRWVRREGWDKEVWPKLIFDIEHVPPRGWKPNNPLRDPKYQKKD